MIADPGTSQDEVAYYLYIISNLIERYGAVELTVKIATTEHRVLMAFYLNFKIFESARRGSTRSFNRAEQTGTLPTVLRTS